MGIFILHIYKRGDGQWAIADMGLSFEGLLLGSMYFIWHIHWVGDYIIVVVLEAIEGCVGRWVEYIFMYAVGFFCQIMFDNLKFPF